MKPLDNIEEETSAQFVGYLIRREFDNLKIRSFQKQCIKAAEEFFLNDLAEEMKQDYKLEHNEE